MTIFKGGASLQYFQGGVQLNGRFVGGNNLLGDTVSGGTEFTFDDAGVTFSVTRDGLVSLGITNGTIASATWLDGGSTGPTSMTITRTNTVVVNVPDGYENTGETVSGTVTAVQQGASRPTVVTNNPTFVASNSFTMNGQITDQGGYPILDSGFFYVGYSTNSVNSIISGTYQHDGGSGFISEAVSANPNTSYSYVAAARNQLGWTYGTANILTTPQVQATAAWETYPSGQPTGGTYSSTTEGTFGAWTGGSNIQPTTPGSTPTSACCGTESPECTLTRSKTDIDHYTGATQGYVRICELKTSGAGTPTCDGFPVGTEQALPSQNNATRNVVNVVVETIDDVTNSCQAMSDPPFTLSNLTVYSCTLSQNGQSGSATTNVGTTTTKTSFNNANSSTNTITVNATFTIQFTIPPDFQDAGSLMTLSFTTACTQPGVEATPEFTPNSANVIFLAGVGGNPQQSAGNGSFITVAGDTGQNYTVTAPSATGGTVSTGASGFGAGTFSLLGGGRLHTFTLSGSPETYSFTVAAGGSSGGGFF